VLGCQLPVGFVTPGEPVPGVDESLLGLLAGTEMYDSVLDMSKLSRTFGIEPTPLEVVVGRMFGGIGS
jgi:hypothetical protein